MQAKPTGSEKAIAFLSMSDSLPDLITGYKYLYKHDFGNESDFSNVVIPKHRDDYDRLIIIPQGLTAQKVFDICSNKFTCDKWDDDKSLDKVYSSGRNASRKSYAIWVRDSEVCPEKYENISVDDMRKEGLDDITLTERLVHEYIYWKLTGTNLVTEHSVICGGSYAKDGDQPYVFRNLHDQRLCVYQYDSLDNVYRYGGRGVFC